MGLFSPNEQAEDIATADLKYLLVSYLLGEAQSCDSTRERSLRMQRLEEAAASLTKCAVCYKRMITAVLPSCTAHAIDAHWPSIGDSASMQRHLE